MSLCRRLIVLALLAVAAPHGASAAVNQSSDPAHGTAFYEDALKRFNSGDVEGAVIQLKNALRVNARDLSARILIGRAYNDLGYGAVAERHLQIARRDGADEAVVLPLLGEAYLLQGKYDAVLSELQPAQRGWTVEARIFNLRGRAFLAKHQLDSATQAFLGAQALTPNNVDSTIGLSRVEVAKGRPQRALDVLEAGLQETPDSASLWFTLGELRRARNDRNGAIQAFGKAIEFQPEYFEARLNRPASLIDAGELDAAMADIGAARAIHSDDARILYMEGTIHLRKGETDAARASMDQAGERLAALPKNAIRKDSQLLLVAGMVAMAQNRIDEAGQYLSDYVKAVPSNASARIALARVYQKEGKAEQAIALLEPIVRRMRIDDARLLTVLGESYMSARRFQDAERVYRRAARADPKSMMLRARLGVSRIASGHRDEGLGDLDAALELGDKSGALGPVLPILYVQNGELDKARKAAERFATLAPDNPMAANILGGIKLAQGDGKGARMDFEHALKVDPTFLDAQSNLVTLDIREGKIESAKARLAKLVKDDGQKKFALARLAAIAKGEGNIDLAVQYLEQLRKLDISALEPQLELARIQLLRRRPQDALTVLKALETRYPSDLGVLTTMAAAYERLAQRGRAQEVLRRAADIAKTVKDRIRIARQQAALADIEGARKTLLAAVAASPSDLPAQVELVELDLANGHADEALFRVHDLKAAFPEAAVVDRLMGDIFVASKRYAQALEPYRQAFTKEPSSLAAIRVAQTHVQLGDTQAGIKVLDDWIADHPDDGLARRALASVYAEAGDTKKAVALYETLIKEQPRDALSRNNLASLYLEMGDDRAHRQAELAFRLAPGNPSVLDTLGWVLVQKGQPARALPLLREAMARRSEDPGIGYHLAEAFHQLGQDNDAIATLRATLSRSRGGAATDQAREMLSKLEAAAKPKE